MAVKNSSTGGILSGVEGRGPPSALSKMMSEFKSVPVANI